MRIQSFGSQFPPVYPVNPLQTQRINPTPQTQAAFGARTISFGQSANASKPTAPLNPNLGRKLDFYA